MKEHLRTIPNVNEDLFGENGETKRYTAAQFQIPLLVCLLFVRYFYFFRSATKSHVPLI
jgi:hypothetical protein